VITILNFSQRAEGINDTICGELLAGFTARGIPVCHIKARELTIGYCNNCRSCMQAAGDELGECHVRDDMKGLLDTVLNSRCLIVSAPINCYDLPSLVRVMLERMSVFCYWPDEKYSPAVRRMPHEIRGVLITTSALPGIMVPLLTRARKSFRLFARPLRVTKINYCHLGFKGRRVDLNYTEKDRRVVGKIISDLARFYRSVSES
jgi:NADPH-dependent FMN reductase